MKDQPPLFRAFRALGYITDSVPFAMQRRGKEAYVTVSVGKAWQTYNTGKLTLVLVGPQMPGSIHALAVKGELTFAAVGNRIIECKRVHKSGQYVGHVGQVVQLMVMENHLLSLSADGQLLVWRIGERNAPQASVTLPPGFQPTCLCHPDTYLNKVVVGGQDGRLLLINFATGNILYTFKGWGSAVRAVVASPALDVVGVALADGRAALLNLKYDETLVVFSNAAGVGLASGLLLGGADATAAHATGGGAASGLGACTCLAFRTGAGVPLMAAGGGSGVITVWDLNERKLHAVIQDAHDAPLVALHFFPGEPLLQSAGADNAVKHWVFDAAQPKPRLLRFRSGHAAPPTIVRHYGEGTRLLSAGSDRAFRVFSTIQDQQSRELSQKHVAKRAKRLKVRESELKLARVIGMDACTVRERDWANVLTAHEGDPTAYVWRLAHFTIGEHELRPPTPHAPLDAHGRPSAAAKTIIPPGGPINAPVTSVALSSCGNFGVVGSSAGRIDRYNMQSGMHRGVYGRSQGTAPAQVLGPAHGSAVTGLAVDACNKLLVSVGLDAQLRIWDFKTQQMKCEVHVGSPVTHLAMSSGSGLVGVAGDDLMLRCYDIEAEGRLVRRFKGHKDRITCLQLSADARWLMSSSMDGTLRVWDVPAAQCLQVLRLGAPVTSFSLSPAQDMMATCHVNRRGVYLWSNQAVFGNPADFIHSEAPVDAALPALADGLQGQGHAQDKQPGKQQAARVAGQAGKAQQESDSSDSEGEEQEEQQAVGLELFSSDEDEGYASAEADDVSTSTLLAGSDVDMQGEQSSPWQAADPASGTPTPLAPTLVTLSLLPRTQWHSLLHLEAIKARNRPIAPPKKPEAAPFFLPTVAGLSGNPTFDTSAPSQAEDEAEEAEAGPAASKVVRAQGGLLASSQDVQGVHQTEFVRLLRAGSEAGDWTSFIAYVRGLSPSALDREVRALQLLTGVDEEEEQEEDTVAAAAVQDIACLLETIDAQLASGTNFEFCTSLLQLVLQVHGDAVMERPVLRGVAARVHKRLGPIWARLDTLLADTRCMTSFFGNLQA